MNYKPRLKVYKCKSGKNVFNPETFEATSYDWWVYVKKIKNTIVFNDYNYSVTTTKHQWEMKSLLKELYGKLNIVYTIQCESLSEGLYLDTYQKRLELAKFKLTFKGRTEKFYLNQKHDLEEAKNKIKVLKKLGAKLKELAKTIKSRIIENETNRLEKNRVKSIEQRKRRQELVKQFTESFNSTDSVSI